LADGMKIFSRLQYVSSWQMAWKSLAGCSLPTPGPQFVEKIFWSKKFLTSVPLLQNS